MRKIFYFTGLLLAFSCSNAELDLSKANHPKLKKQVAVKKCKETPSESAGSFPIKNPENLVKSDIISGKTGVKLTINLIVEYKGKLLKDASVDVWNCDSQGKFSQYGSNVSENFLRGRQITDDKGKVQFKTIFPSWTKGRAPHVFVQIKTKEGKSIKITQLALPQKTQDKVFKKVGYKGLSPVKNTNDKVFSDSLDCNLPDKILGTVNSGFTIEKKIIIK